MRLLKLSANKPSFHTVVFRPEGLSLVVAEQKSDKSALTSTYNGVGKTLVLELIHYCLGSSKRVAFEKHLKGWVFNLTVDVEGAQHMISRSADTSGDISLDGKAISLAKLRGFLGDAFFDTNQSTPFVTFRSMIRRFIRSGKSAYVDFSYASEKEARKPYSVMLNNAALLGIDLDLARKKYDLRRSQEKLNGTMKALEKEPLFAKLLVQDTVDIELMSLRERAAKLEANLESFEVAEDYHEIEQEANQIKRELDGHRRETIKLSEAIAQIDRSLVPKQDLPAERVFRLYEEAQAALPQSVKRDINEVVDFQQELQRKRTYRLSRDRQRLDRELRKQRENVKSSSTRLDEKLRYLSEHRALDEYLAVSNELSECRQRITKLEESKALRNTVDRELKKIDLELAAENLRTDEYLESAASLIDEGAARFHSFARELYGSRPSGLSIGNDSGGNQQRYRIAAHIEADAAEGINEAKIFCFDMTVLSLRRGHRARFLAHDSTLFGPVDPRQRLAMFRIADRVCREFGVQYIATLNLHDITSIRQQVPVEPAEIDDLFDAQTVVLRLTDELATDKLLGIQVDMDYTE